MQTIGIGELQKNVGILTHLKEALTIIDKRKNREVAIIYPIKIQKKASIVKRLGGKYTYLAKNEDKTFQAIREEAMMIAMKEKYDLPD